LQPGGEEVGCEQFLPSASAEVGRRQPIEAPPDLFLHNWYKPHFEKALLRRV
jgi:hypothetical protein